MRNLGGDEAKESHTSYTFQAAALAEADAIQEPAHISKRVQDTEHVASHDVQRRHRVAYVLCAH